mmetsp:Transcript_115587/g.326774  ORF Transcript_115587/g.326774 Transcript_115587/m.326774 type:complete len:252 (-) Transcript_115587:667-1422(-)
MLSPTAFAALSHFMEFFGSRNIFTSRLKKQRVASSSEKCIGVGKPARLRSFRKGGSSLSASTMRRRKAYIHAEKRTCVSHRSQAMVFPDPSNLTPVNSGKRMPAAPSIAPTKPGQNEVESMAGKTRLRWYANQYPRTVKVPAPRPCSCFNLRKTLSLGWRISRNSNACETTEHAKPSSPPKRLTTVRRPPLPRPTAIGVCTPSGSSRLYIVFSKSLIASMLSAAGQLRICLSAPSSSHSGQCSSFQRKPSG